MNNEFKLKDIYIENLQKNEIYYDIQGNTNDDGEITSWSIFPRFRSDVSSSDELAIIIDRNYYSVYVKNIVKNVDNREKMLNLIDNLNGFLVVTFNGSLLMNSENGVDIIFNSFFYPEDDYMDANLEMIQAGISRILDIEGICFKKLMEGYYSA